MTGRVAVLGGRGMLGRELVPALAAAGWEVAVWGRREADVTDPEALARAAHAFRPEVVVHAAAWTDVDGCEKDPDRAYRVNALGTRNVAALCRDLGCELLYVSTDFVFDGRKGSPYLEDDPLHPLSVYGRSKAWGEAFVRELTNRHWIVRTQWLYGAGGRNFVDTMRRLMSTRPAIEVVVDQVGSPTWTRELAQALTRILAAGGHGTYHASARGEVSWYGLAQAVARAVGYRGELRPVSAAQWGAPAPRPPYSVLRNYHLELTLGDPFRPWEEALAAYLDETGPQGAGGPSR